MSNNDAPATPKPAPQEDRPSVKVLKAKQADIEKAIENLTTKINGQMAERARLTEHLRDVESAIAKLTTASFKG